MLECEQVEGDGPGRGARYRAVHKPGPKASELRIEMLGYAPPHHITYEQVDDAGTFLVSYELESIDEGRTRITQTDETSWNGIFKVLSPILHLVVRRTLPEQFAALEETLESETTAPE